MRRKIAIEEIIEFFRHDENVRKIAQHYKEEIALACVSYSDDIANILNSAYNLHDARLIQEPVE